MVECREIRESTNKRLYNEITDRGGVHTINKTTQRLEKPKLRNNKKHTTKDNTWTETEADKTD